MQLDKEVYTISEIAELFGVTKPTVYDWMKNRGLIWLKVGMRRRITREALLDFIVIGNEEDIQPAAETIDHSQAYPEAPEPIAA